MNLSLYHLAKDQQAFFEKLVSTDGEIPLSEEQKLSELQELIKTKGSSICEFRQSLTDISMIIKERILELKRALEVTENKIKHLDNYVLACMKIMSINSIERDEWSIKIRKPSKTVEITDINAITHEYMKPAPEVKPEDLVDKMKISKSLKANIDVPGAILIDGKESITFKLGR